MRQYLYVQPRADGFCEIDTVHFEDLLDIANANSQEIKQRLRNANVPALTNGFIVDIRTKKLFVHRIIVELCGLFIIEEKKLDSEVSFRLNIIVKDKYDAI